MRTVKALVEADWKNHCDHSGCIRTKPSPHYDTTAEHPLHIAFDASAPDIVPFFGPVDLLAEACNLRRPYIFGAGARIRLIDYQHFVYMPLGGGSPAPPVWTAASNAAASTLGAKGRPPAGGVERIPLRSRTNAQADSSPIQVFVSKDLSGSHIRYRYRVVNGGANPVKALKIGYDRLNDELQLSIAPFGWDGNATPSSGFEAPSSWSFQAIPAEEDSVGMVEWETNADSSAIHSGQSVSEFAVILPDEDPMYEQGSWMVNTTGGGTPFYTGLLSYENPTGVEEEASLDRGRQIWAIPNPTSGGARIQFVLPSRSSYEVSVFDVQGRLVRRLDLGLSVGGITRLMWDGRDASGVRVASGMYFLRLKSGERERITRIVMLR